ncbi:MAG: HlyC/CorC family transporter [Hyphomicrobiaceae bacterium]|nr:HlyC/CorC family transporter [Hyphomicrobiaceae bacterium]
MIYETAFIATLAGVAVLLVLSAFFSGAETALTAVSRAKMHALEQEGNARAKQVSGLLAQPERIIGTVLLGNNLVNILASSLTTSLLIALAGEAGVVYATLAMTFVVVIFCEVLPKTYAIAYSEGIALAIAPVMRFLIVVLKPLTAVIDFIVRQILKLTPTHTDDDANILAAHELRGTIELSHREGAVDIGDAKRLGGVLDLRELQVEDIMVHRTEMETINADDPPQKIVDDVLRSQYTRVPVWRDEPDNIVGVLHSKDLLAALGRSGWKIDSIDVTGLSSDPWFVPDTTSVNDQLNAFLARKSQLALVIDEYGEVQGLITLEDILEEIVGQIADEHDVGDNTIRPQADGAVNVDGSVAIRDLNREMDWDLPDDEAVTVAGLVIHEAQTIPEPGQAFTFYGYRFEILRKSRNRITALRVKPVPAEASTSNNGSSAASGGATGPGSDAAV